MPTWAKISTRVKEHKGAEKRQNENYRTSLSLGDMPHLKVFFTSNRFTRIGNYEKLLNKVIRINNKGLTLLNMGRGTPEEKRFGFI